MVYLVTCNHPECQKKYIGLKFFYRNWGKVTKQTDSDWRTYKTSSKYVKEAIEKYGMEHFTFEVIQVFDTRAGVVSGEVEYQWAARVLHATNEDGSRAYFNNAIGNIKFIAKEFVSEATKQKLSKAWETRIVSEETGKRISEALKGKIVSDETKQKLSDAKKGTTNWLGRSHSEEAKLKISLASKGRVVTQETRDKISATRKMNNEKAKPKP